MARAPNDPWLRLDLARVLMRDGKEPEARAIMADMGTRIEAARLLVYRAARMKDAGTPFSQQASMAKLFASETAMFCAHAAVQMFGGYGFVREYPVEKLFRDAKITEIYEGTSEIQRLVISRHMLRA